MLMRNADIARLLNPKPVSWSRFEEIKKEITDRIAREDSGIAGLLDEYGDIPFYFKPEDTEKFMPSIRDVARLYVLINYLLSESLQQPFVSAEYYRKFFDNQMDEVKQYISSVINPAEEKPVSLPQDVKVDVVSGSVYKVKKYFLENNRIKDIRGASALIKYMSEDITLDYFNEKYIPECVIYCGGGNMLAFVPAGQGKTICKEFETKYADISLTARHAFEHISCSLDELMKDYNEKMRELNEKLDERKKVKIYPINPDSELDAVKIGPQLIRFDKAERIDAKNAVCELCAVRDAVYRVPAPEEPILACPSCMRKNRVGDYKAIFYDEYEDFIGKSPERDVSSVSDIQDENGQVAVIYADGNNMGNIVMNINSPFEHMYFSRRLDYVTKSSVYRAIHKVMEDKARFEAIALGGDDVFIIVPGDTSLEINNEIINAFDKSFEGLISMSAGVCIAKHSTPIRSMLGVAQAKMKIAKDLVRNKGLREGTVDIDIIQSNINLDLNSKKFSLFPVESSRLARFIEVIKNMKRSSEINRSQLYKLRHAYEKMKKVPYEFQLFYMYQTKRLSNQYSLLTARLFDIKPDKFSGLIENNDLSSKETFISPWNDIILLWDCIGGA